MSVDTMTYFTSKGHWVLLFLIQLGGLNFIAFGSFLGAGVQIWGGRQTARRDRGLRQQRQPAGQQWHLGQGGRCGAWTWKPGRGGPDGLVVPGSAFNGLGIASSRLCSTACRPSTTRASRCSPMALRTPWVATNWLVHWVITVLVFLGALGMVAMFDLFDLRKLRERMAATLENHLFPRQNRPLLLVHPRGLGHRGICCAGVEWHDGGHVWIWEKSPPPCSKASRAPADSTPWTSARGHAHAVPPARPDVHWRVLPAPLEAASKRPPWPSCWPTFGAPFVAETTSNSSSAPSVPSCGPGLQRLAVLPRGQPGGRVCAHRHRRGLGHRGASTFFDLAFEHVSAMGTVGLSTGIDALLSSGARWCWRWPCLWDVSAH